MKATYHAGIHRYALFVAGWTVVLLTAGALVTSKDAALAVPDWPLSYGTLNPPMVGGILYEHSHRMIAAALGLLIIVLAFWLWRKDERPVVRWVGLAALGGVIVQGVLGGLTVLKLLHYWLPVMHACTAQIMFGLLVGIAVVTSKWWMQNQPQYEDGGTPAIHAVVTANATVIFLQTLLGAGFRHHYISVIPHLVGAAAVLGVVLWTTAILKRRFGQTQELNRARLTLYTLLGAQLLLGAGSLWTRILNNDEPQPLPLMVAFTVAHTVTGALLFATAITTVLLCYRLVPRKREVIFATTSAEVHAQ